jgi:hypothetical protein
MLQNVQQPPYTQRDGLALLPNMTTDVNEKLLRQGFDNLNKNEAAEAAFRCSALTIDNYQVIAWKYTK